MHLDSLGLKMNKIKIKEAIIVEGKDDAANLNRVVDAEIIITHGFGLNKAIENNILRAAKARGVIIFTDPDYAGKGIRKRVDNLLLDVGIKAKHAYLSREEATKKDNIGVENADEEALLSALEAAKAVSDDNKNIYQAEDVLALGLSGREYSKELRQAVAKHFRISYGNGKAILKQLNLYAVPRQNLLKYIELYRRENGKIN